MSVQIDMTMVNDTETFEIEIEFIDKHFDDENFTKVFAPVKIILKLLQNAPFIMSESQKDIVMNEYNCLYHL